MEERGLSHHCPAARNLSVCVYCNDDYGNFHVQITLGNNPNVEYGALTEDNYRINCQYIRYLWLVMVN